MTSAIEMSNKAWDENKALTDEANKRYETTESKLKMLRNEVTDVAIEFGGPLVDALRDGLEASKPLIQGAVDLGAVVVVEQMAQLMEQHVVDALTRSLHQQRVQRDSARG